MQTHSDKIVIQDAVSENNMVKHSVFEIEAVFKY